ncbi:MAG: DUF881 domain-containing protein [Candidatus Desulforudis sp.]|nr:DUF881 domain-containing protein [Desulforudis sp.]
MQTRYLSIAVVTVILGLLVGLQVKLLGVPEEPPPPPSARAETLTKELKELTWEKEALWEEIQDLEKTVQSARQGIEQAETALRAEIEKHMMLAGLTGVIGPGVEVTLENTPGGDFLFAVRDEDLLRVVNELRAAGAEAIAINERRLVGSSEIRQAGPFINVNLERTSPPYRIQAIGNPDDLARALELPGGLVDTARYVGIEINIEAKEELVLPGYQGRPRLDFARPLREGV